MPMYWTGGWGDWLLMSILMVVVWGAVVWAIVVTVRSFGERRDGEGRPASGSGALEILEERFARGEIDEKEFLERRRALTERDAHAA